ncbi:MAG: TRAP transporter substrate-binding protein [Spirochaetes bacterium]|nr:TRAP transporter substrate-binding protein [Spirochaetota bacterium]
MGKRLLATVLVLSVAAAVFSGCSGNKGDDKQIVLRLAETHPADYPTTKGDMEFARLVEERSNGRIKVEVYHSKQLGEEKAAIEQVQFGAIDLTRVSIAPLTEFVKELIALQLPYVYRNGDHMWKVLEGPIGEDMLKKVEAGKFVGLCYYDPGSRSFYNSKKEVKSVDDLKGMKIRVMESKMMIDMINALGASPTPMPYGEVYSAIQTGVIDGAENNWPSYDSSSHFEVAKYYTTDGHLRVPEILIMSKLVFDKLSSKDQKLIRQAAKDSVAVQKKLWADKEKESEAKVVAAGSKITRLDDAEIAKFQAKMEPLYKQYAEFADLMEKIKNTK